MRSAIGVSLIFTLTSCATASPPEDRPESEAAIVANAQLDDLRVLEGAWWGTGGQGTDRNPVEFRYHVTDRGTVVEETCFVGMPEQFVTRYHVDRERLVGERTWASGTRIELVAWPGDAVWQISYTHRGRFGEGTSSNDCDLASLSGRVWKKDTNRHGIAFSVADATPIDTRSPGPQSVYGLMIAGNSEIFATWRSSKGDGESEGFRSYHLTRKLPGSVERTANWERPEERQAQSKKSWLDERSNWDLRGVHP